MDKDNKNLIRFNNLGFVKRTEKVRFLDPRGIIMWYEAWVVRMLIDEGGITEGDVCQG